MPDPAQNLAEDLIEYLLADATIADLFEGRCYNGDAPREADLPYLTFEKLETNRLNTFKAGCGVTQATIHLHARATSATTAERLSTQLHRRLLASSSYTPAPFNGANSREIGRYTNGPNTTALDPDRAPYGADCWVASFPVTWILAEG
jgi:hypothetical protein